MEDSAIFNCGSGSTLTLDGKVEMDASIMTSNGEFGAVGAIEQVKNPILVARQVMEKTDHLILVGKGAQQFARKMGFTKHEKILDIQKRRLERFKLRGNSVYFPKLNYYLKLGTVGAVALDNNHQIAAANSTGGILGKMSGRLGDTPIFGAGIYAVKNGGVAATGHGEAIMRLFWAKYVCELMSRLNARSAIKQGIKLARENNALCGIIALDHKANVSYDFTTQSMSWGYISKSGVMKLF